MNRQSRLTIGPVLPAAQGGTAGQAIITLNGRLKGRIMTQALMIIQVLIAQGQSIDPLPQKALQAMSATGRTTTLAQPLAEGCRQSQIAIRLTQKHHTAVAGDFTAGETGLYSSSLCPWKLNDSLVTFRHGEVSFVS